MLIHGQDQVKKLPITIQKEGLMYNPVNMQVDDADRLHKLDLRNKNKKIRYEVKYDFEKNTRNEFLAEQDRIEQMKMQKCSGLRFKEETERGFDILSG